MRFFVSAVFLVAASFSLMFMPAGAQAAQPSGDWCADAIQFSMDTAMYRDFGRDHALMSGNIDSQWMAFEQQFPRLSKPDMHRLLDAVFTNHWTRFQAAKSVLAQCERTTTPPTYRPAYLTAGHAEEWCADAVDYAMFTSVHLNFGYSLSQVNTSVEKGFDTYHELFPQLKQQDLLALNRSAHDEKWKRVDAAEAVSNACKVSGAMRKTSIRP